MSSLGREGFFLKEGSLGIVPLNPNPRLPPPIPKAPPGVCDVEPDSIFSLALSKREVRLSVGATAVAAAAAEGAPDDEEAATVSAAEDADAVSSLEEDEEAEEPPPDSVDSFGSAEEEGGYDRSPPEEPEGCGLFDCERKKR